MITLKRLELIKKLRNEGATLEEIGLKLKPVITAERVRQLLDPVEQKFCEDHKTLYVKHCRFCTVKSRYNKILDETNSKFLDIELKRFQPYNRNKEVIIQKTMLIRKMRDEYKMSFQSIADKLNRDRGSIIHSYYNTKI